MKQIILGIDPGSQHLGVGCIAKEGNSIQLIFAEAISAPAHKPLYTRLGQIAERLEEVLARVTPDTVAVEDVFYKQNPKSVFHLGVARGVAIAACLKRGLEIFEYPPTQVKLAVTGFGRADKAQVKKMVELSVGAKLSVRFDATDALAVAICHAHMHRFVSPEPPKRALKFGAT